MLNDWQGGFLSHPHSSTCIYTIGCSDLTTWWSRPRNGKYGFSNSRLEKGDFCTRLSSKFANTANMNLT